MIALNLFYFEIYAIYKEDMINQLDQGKTGCGKIAADIHQLWQVIQVLKL